MAVSSTDIHVSAAHPVSGATFLADLKARWARWRLYRQTVNELSELNDMDLADIGMSRAGIRSVAWHAVYG